MKLLYTCIFIGLTITALATFCSCRKTHPCPNGRTTTEDLTASTLSKVPYSGYDTLYFSNKQGDTCIVCGNGKQYYYKTETPIVNADCVSDVVRVQGYSISFTPVKGELVFSIDLRGTYDLDILVKKYRDVYRYSTNEIGIVGRPDDTFYIDTMTINNVLFKTITRAYTSNYNFQAYYNKEYGLLKIVNKEANEEYSIIK